MILDPLTGVHSRDERKKARRPRGDGGRAREGRSHKPRDLWSPEKPGEHESCSPRAFAGGLAVATSRPPEL